MGGKIEVALSLGNFIQFLFSKARGQRPLFISKFKVTLRLTA